MIGAPGGEGGACGVAVAVELGNPVPAMFVAVTLKVYAVPLVRLVTVIVVVAESCVVPGLVVTV